MSSTKVIEFSPWNGIAPALREPFLQGDMRASLRAESWGIINLIEQVI